MATLTVQKTAVPSLAVATAAATALGDDVTVVDDLHLFVRNDDAVSHTVTLVTSATVRGVAVSDPVVTVAAGAVALIPLPRDLYRNPSTGKASWTYDAVTSVKVAAVQAVR